MDPGQFLRPPETARRMADLRARSARACDDPPVLHPEPARRRSARTVGTNPNRRPRQDCEGVWGTLPPARGSRGQGPRPAEPELQPPRYNHLAEERCVRAPFWEAP